MNLYREIAEGSERAKTERNDCAVRTATVLLGRPYDEIHDAFRFAGRRNRCGTYDWMMESVLRRFGCQIRTDVSIPQRGKTLATLPSALVLAGRITDSYVIRTSEHFCAFHNGRVHDWTPGGRRRVQRLDLIILPR